MNSKILRIIHKEFGEIFRRQGYPVERSWIDLVRVESLRGLGRTEAADSALATAAARVASRASRLALEDRDSYVARVVPNARLLALRWPA